MLRAFVFPGQGSQSLGMLKELAAIYPLVEETFALASEALGYDLWCLIQDGSEAELGQTRVTQPAMLTAGLAVWQIWRERGGLPPSYLAGHSLGEYTALVCAEALTLEDAIRLVEKRGRYMQEAVPEGQGAMAAVIGLADDEVIAACREAAEGEVVSAVNFNSPGQVVIAGQAAAVERALEIAKNKGAKRALRLAVSVPSHCDLMRPAAQRLERYLEDVEIRVPRIPIIHNVDVRRHDDAADVRRVLVEQLYQPVRWVETIEALASLRVGMVVECGPGKVLTGLNKRIVADLIALPVYDPSTLDKALAT